MKQHKKDKNLNKDAKRYLNVTSMQKCKNCSHVCAYHCTQHSNSDYLLLIVQGPDLQNILG